MYICLYLLHKQTKVFTNKEFLVFWSILVICHGNGGMGLPREPCCSFLFEKLAAILL